MIVKVWLCDFRKMKYLSMKSPTIVTKRRGHRKADCNPHGKTVIGLKEKYWNSLLLQKQSTVYSVVPGRGVFVARQSERGSEC